MGSSQQSGEEQKAADPRTGPQLLAELAAQLEKEGKLSELPVSSLKEAVVHYRRPFTISAVKFKVQSEWPEGEPKAALIAPYIDSRLASDRLNAVAPDLWSDHYESVATGKSLRCFLTVDGVTREDVGEGFKDKELHSDALKRAAVKFGVGAFLYAMPKIIIKTGGDKLKVKVRKRQGKPDKKYCELTPAGEQYCRSFYASWLEKEGIERFGQPLGHGDAFDAAGDLETEAPAPDDTSSPEPESREEPDLKKPLSDEGSLKLKTEAEALWKALPAPVRRDIGFPTKASFTKQLEGAMLSRPKLDALVKALRDAKPKGEAKPKDA